MQYLLQLASYFRAIIGPQYDLVGFDPRGSYPKAGFLGLIGILNFVLGIGVSAPVLSIFDTPAAGIELFSTYPVSLNESDSSFGRAYGLGKTFNDIAISHA